jgi:hypothetical protein
MIRISSNQQKKGCSNKEKVEGATHIEYGISGIAYTLLLLLTMMKKMARRVNVIVTFYITLKLKKSLIDQIETNRK